MTNKNAVLPFLAIGCFLCLFGCGTKAPREKVAEPIKPMAPKVEVKQVEALPEKDKCEGLLDEMVQKARRTRKTVKESCRDMKLEITPMWDANFDGTVHVRTYDASGKKIRDEYKKP